MVALPVLLVLGAAGWRLVLRVPHRPAPAWAAGGTVLAALAFAVWTALTHGEHVVLRRDGGSYALFAQWLATRHGLPVEPFLSAFGGPAALDVPGLTFARVPASSRRVAAAGSSSSRSSCPGPRRCSRSAGG